VKADQNIRRPEPKVRDIVIDLLQPVFRKDEESAWTLVQSRNSTKFQRSSRSGSFFSRPTSVVGELGQAAELRDNKRFAFENDLVTGPVYKRVLFAYLCNFPTVPESMETVMEHCEPVQTNQSLGVNLGDSAAPTTQGQSVFVGEGVDWSPENICRVLQRSAGFSISVLRDCQELRAAEKPSSLPKRNLPLGSILKRHEMLPEKQRFLNAKLILAAAEQDLTLMAESLEEGADVNTLSEDNRTALQICLHDAPESLAVDLLLLYRETNIQCRDEVGDTLLHQAVRVGDASRFCRLITFVDDLRVVDTGGATPLHTAAVNDYRGLAILEKLNDLYEGDDFNADTCLDRKGRSPLHWATQAGNEEHTYQLLRLGCDPSLLPQAGKRSPGSNFEGSPLYRAVAAGHFKVVQRIFDFCASSTSDNKIFVNLANWKHHPVQSLLECARESQLPQKYNIIEVLISQGADFAGFWRDSDQALAYAVKVQHARLFLRLLLRGCRPKFASIDVTQILPDIQAASNCGLLTEVVAAMFKDGTLADVEAGIFARLSRSSSTSSQSVFTETLSLMELFSLGLDDVTQPPRSTAASESALAVAEHANDPGIPHAIVSVLDSGTLGQFYAFADRYEIDPSSKNKAGLTTFASQISRMITDGST